MKATLSLFSQKRPPRNLWMQLCKCMHKKSYETRQESPAKPKQILIVNVHMHMASDCIQEGAGMPPPCQWCLILTSRNCRHGLFPYRLLFSVLRIFRQNKKLQILDAICGKELHDKWPHILFLAPKNSVHISWLF